MKKMNKDACQVEEEEGTSPEEEEAEETCEI